MWNIRRSVLGILFAVSCLLLYSCGSAGVSEWSAKPLGLFTGPTADVAEMPPAEGAVAGALMAIDSTKRGNFSGSQYGDLAAKSVKAIVSGVQTDAECTLIAKDQVNCEQMFFGDEGFVHFFTEANVSQYNDNDISGVMDARISFHRYVANDACGRAVEVMGSLVCDLNFTASLNDGTSHFAGACHTSADDGDHLDVTAADAVHQIGVDLGVEFEGDAVDINGIVSIGGTNYKYEDIEGIGNRVCE